MGTKGTSSPDGNIQVKGGENWGFSGRSSNPYHQEHADNIASIRAGKPLNEARQVAESTFTAILGRESCYGGQLLEWDAALQSTRALPPEKPEFGALPFPEVAQPGKYKSS